MYYLCYILAMAPFGQTLWLWRLERRLTQDALAWRAGISRPNLSAIERGKREVSLGTLRALAAALNVRPGVLVDGVAPSSAEPGAARWSRQALERIAEAVVRGTSVREAREQALVEALRWVLRHRLSARRQLGGRARRGKRAAEAAWLRLEAAYPREVIQSALQRIEDRWRRA